MLFYIELTTKGTTITAIVNAGSIQNKHRKKSVLLTERRRDDLCHPVDQRIIEIEKRFSLI